MRTIISILIVYGGYTSCTKKCTGFLKYKHIIKNGLAILRPMTKHFY